MSTTTIYSEAHLTEVLQANPHSVVFYFYNSEARRRFTRQINGLNTHPDVQATPVYVVSIKVLSRDYINRRGLLNVPAISYFVGQFEYYRSLGQLQFAEVMQRVSMLRDVTVTANRPEVS